MKQYQKEFAQNLLKYEGCLYELGKSSRHKSDCSGSVCGALCMTYGIALRVTADSLYKSYFTEIYKNGSCSIHAAFFLDKEGKAVHVAGWLYGNLYLNVSSYEKDKRGHIRNLEELRSLYPHLKIVLRELNEENLWK